MAMIFALLLHSHTFTTFLTNTLIKQCPYVKIKPLKKKHTCSKTSTDVLKDRHDCKRICNKTLKSEFFRKIRSQYTYWHNDIYKKQERVKSIENAEYLVWDNLHQDVEAYEKNRAHIGSIDPKTLCLYKPAVAHRVLPK